MTTYVTDYSQYTTVYDGQDFGATPLSLIGVSNVLVRNCTWTNANNPNSGAIVVQQCNNIWIEGCTINGTTTNTRGIYLTNTGGSTNVTIYNNTIVNTGGSGIVAFQNKNSTTGAFIADHIGVKIVTNTLQNCGYGTTDGTRHAIYSQSRESYIEGNTIEDTPDGNAIRLESSGYIHNNICRRTARSAIVYQEASWPGSSSTVRIEWNIVEQSGLEDSANTNDIHLQNFVNNNFGDPCLTYYLRYNTCQRSITIGTGYSSNSNILIVNNTNNLNGATTYTLPPFGGGTSPNSPPPPLPPAPPPGTSITPPAGSTLYLSQNFSDTLNPFTAGPGATVDLENDELHVWSLSGWKAAVAYFDGFTANTLVVLNGKWRSDNAAGGCSVVVWGNNGNIVTVENLSAPGTKQSWSCQFYVPSDGQWGFSLHNTTANVSSYYDDITIHVAPISSSPPPPPPPPPGVSIPADPHSGQSWKLVFDEEFNGTAIDQSKWTDVSPSLPDLGHGNLSGNQLEWNSFNNVTVSGGQLTFTARRESYTSPSSTSYTWTSGMITTKTFAIKYGYIEARIKVPSTSGFWPGFWTWQVPGQATADGTDVFRFRSDDRTKLYLASRSGSFSTVYSPVFDPSMDWHVYGVNVQPEGTTWYLDGVQIATAANAPTNAVNLGLNLAVYAVTPPASGTTSATMLVDYVRVYSDDPAAVAVTPQPGYPGVTTPPPTNPPPTSPPPTPTTTILNKNFQDGALSPLVLRSGGNATAFVNAGGELQITSPVGWVPVEAFFTGLFGGGNGTITGDWRSDSGGGCNITLYDPVNSTNVLSLETFTTYTWTPFSGTFKIPSNGQLGIGIHSTTPNIASYFDNIKIVVDTASSPPPTNPPPTNPPPTNPPPPPPPTANYPYNTPTTVKHLYVSTTGNDTTGTGTQSAPYRTISKAVSVVTSNTTVHVAAGTYAETIRSDVDGTSTAPIVYLSDTLRGAKIVPPANSTTNIAWENRGDYVHIVGFEYDGTNYQAGTRHRIGLYTAGANSRIAYCYVHHMSQDTGAENISGTAIYGDGYPYAGGISGGAVNITLEGNEVRNICPVGTSSSLNHGIYHSTTGSIINNLVYLCAGVGIHLWHDARNVLISNNTVFNVRIGIFVGGGETQQQTSGTIVPVTGCTIQNNIVYDVNLIGIEEYGDVGTNTYRNNLAYWSPTNVQLLNGNTDVNTISNHPAFVNFNRNGGGDYHLSSRSPCIDAGSAINAPSLDADGQSRPSGSGYDIGCYEYIATTSPPTTNPPPTNPPPTNPPPTNPPPTNPPPTNPPPSADVTPYLLPTEPPGSLPGTVLLANFDTVVDDDEADIRGVPIQVSGNVTMSRSRNRIGGASIEFPGGINDYLTIPTSSAWNLGSANFVLQAILEFHADGFQPVIGQADDTTTNTSWLLCKNATNQLEFRYVLSGSLLTMAGASTLTKGVRYTITVVRSGTSLLGFVNTSRDVIASISGSIASSTRDLSIGRYEGGGTAPTAGTITLEDGTPMLTEDGQVFNSETGVSTGGPFLMEDSTLILAEDGTSIVTEIVPVVAPSTMDGKLYGLRLKKNQDLGLTGTTIPLITTFPVRG